MSNRNDATGILIVGHGTRDETGTKQFLELVEALKPKLFPAAVEAAFLELREPGIGVGVERLVARGIERLVTVPLLLFAAGHIKRDVPEEVEKAVLGVSKGDFERVQVGHLGCHRGLLELSRQRMEEATVGRAMPNEARRAVPNETQQPMVSTARSTCLLMVARGSSDGEATEEMRRFAKLRREIDEQMHVEVAFLAMAQPSFDEQLQKVADAGFGRVIVQPHFLFAGELVERIRGQTGEMARKHPETDWLVAPPLADRPGEAGLASELLAKVILDRCQEAGFVLS